MFGLPKIYALQEVMKQHKGSGVEGVLERYAKFLIVAFWLGYGEKGSCNVDSVNRHAIDDETLEDRLDKPKANILSKLDKTKFGYELSFRL